MVATAMRRVLIIEDDVNVQALIADTLREQGYDVDVADNGAQGLAVARSHLPDLIVLDLMMPIMDGWSVLRERMNDASLSSVPVLVLSAASAEGLRAAKSLKATAFLPKPYDLDALLAMSDQLSHLSFERGRMEGALLAARTVGHRLNNQLSLTVGYAELLASSADLPEKLRDLAEEAHQGAVDASRTVAQLQQIIRLEEVDIGGGTILDLERSTAVGQDPLAT